MADMWQNLAPHRNIFILNEPGKVSDNISIPKTVVATVSSWMSSKQGYNFTQQQIDNFNSLPVI